MLGQVSYAIGVAEPVSIFVDTYGTAAPGLTDAVIADKIKEMFDLRPGAIEEWLKLRNPIYRETAAYGHMGREPRTVVKTFINRYESQPITREVELFTWEKTDRVDEIREKLLN